MITKKMYEDTFKSIDGNTRRIPYLKIDSEKKGPTIWVTAAIHGDEVTGTAVVQSLIKRFQKEPLLKGILYLVPILNTSGFEANSRREQIAEADLNRNFGGDILGTPSERLAHAILSMVTKTKPDFVLDLHTDSMNSVAYTIIDWFEGKRYQETVEKCINLAKELQLVYGLDSQKAAGYPIDKSFSGQLVSKGIPTITVELGGPLVVNEDMRRRGVDAIWGLLSVHGLVKMRQQQFSKDIQKKPYYFMERITTMSTGIIEYKVDAGDKVSKGAILAIIRDVYASTIEVIRAPQDCIVFSHLDQSVTFPGVDLFTTVSDKPIN